MALYLLLRRNVYRCMRRNVSTNIYNLTNTDVHDKVLTLDVDSLDDFTTQLLQKKIDKWSTRKAISNISLDVKIDKCSKDISHLSISKINVLFQDAIEINSNGQVLELMQQCMSLRVCPTLCNILYTLSVCSQSGDVVTIKKIQDLCKIDNSEILEAQSNFQHYVAEATWIKGNIHKALKLFKEVYRENTLLRCRVRLMIKNLVVELTTCRSEAVLISVVKFGGDLAEQYNDYYPLTCIWQTCFLSEWYSDQCIALDLLRKYELLQAVINRIPYVVAVCLHNHRTDIVYRLLEILLEFKMKIQYSGVLLALLDYQICQKDLGRCVEIVQWSVQNDVQLLPIHNEQFLKLFITNADMNLAHKKFKLLKIPKTIPHFKF